MDSAQTGPPTLYRKLQSSHVSFTTGPVPGVYLEIDKQVVFSYMTTCTTVYVQYIFSLLLSGAE